MPALSASSGLTLPQWPGSWWKASWEYDLRFGHKQDSCRPPATAWAPDPWLKVILCLLRACKTLGAWLTPSDSPSLLQCVSNRLMLAHVGRRGPAERSPRERKILYIHNADSHSLTQNTQARIYTHTNTGCIIYPCGTTPGIQPKHPLGGVWQRHVKWILQRKRFKAFIALSVFQATASQGFDGLFSGSFLDFRRDFVVASLWLSAAEVYWDFSENRFQFSFKSEYPVFIIKPHLLPKVYEEDKCQNPPPPTYFSSK